MTRQQNKEQPSGSLEQRTQISEQDLIRSRIKGAVGAVAAISGLYALEGLRHATGTDYPNMGDYAVLALPFVLNPVFGRTMGRMLSDQWNHSTAGVSSEIDVNKMGRVGAASGALTTTVFGAVAYGIGYGIGYLINS